MNVVPVVLVLEIVKNQIADQAQNAAGRMLMAASVVIVVFAKMLKREYVVSIVIPLTSYSAQLGRVALSLEEWVFVTEIYAANVLNVKWILLGDPQNVKNTKMEIPLLLAGVLDVMVHVNDVRPTLALLILAIAFLMLQIATPVAL